MSGQPARNYQTKNLTGGAADYVLASSSGTLHSIVLGSTSGNPVVVIDGVTSTVAVIGTIKASAAEGTYLYDCCFGAGLRVKVKGDHDISVNYNIGA